MKKVIGLAIILIIAAVLRFYNLGVTPNGLQQDESSIGYNTYSILQTSRDEHGIYLPQNFKAFGEYKLPGYIYASVLPIALFGLNPFAIRFVSAVSGFLSIIVVFFLTETLLKLVPNISSKSYSKYAMVDYLPFITAFMLAINPWHLHFSRAAFEVMLANFFILCGLWLFLKGIDKSRFLYISSSIIFFSASLYTYNIARIFTPVFALILIILFRKKLLSFSKWSYILAMVLYVFCLSPFLIGIITHGGADSTFGTLIFTSAKVQATLQEFRSYFIHVPTPIGKVVFNYWTLTLWQYINNIFAHLSVSYYFIHSSDGITSTGTTGYWYLFELPLVLWGMTWLWNIKNISTKLIFAWIITLVLITSLTREPPQATRTFFLIFPITFCSSIGIYNLINKIRSYSHRYIQYTATIISLLVVTYYVFMYFASYYVRFPVYYAKNWRTADREVALFIRDHQSQYDKILIDQNSGLIYTSILTYLPYPPANFQIEAIWTKEDSEGFTHPKKFGKYEFREIDWAKDIHSPKTLIITTIDKKPLNIALFKTFSYPSRPVVFNVGQEIIRYPTEEIAYVLVESSIVNKK